ncbi:PhaM family polyhydroxyalkanoate granule multifunctional regulatory protein [Paraburkholderia kururiensis]|uniref:PhaM family polyhydroxyalkanoate granule multifunctional regulatory protein n=1 Tax=Paraburkholderia kururiensis TaxID=984307 RepID=A0ABZ0WGJ6_9BURK|nr:PhaM family polyhydroxyalkanoate granule multifunctional regulatory protein [Paraburkholderia kururiensis]WQD76471.1 PhaM family polyhydroxyalkanoate granule multifunctional regulatory protein [Paraburkholderia kururiensis]
MTDQPGSTPPFPGFPGFPPAEMLDRMWDMMRLTPFGSAFPGMQPGAAQGLGPSLSMMSDMLAPLTSVEELDKRITDMRAVEQWLKLNLNMLQSAIQALEVQRATLATLRAFGAFAQSQMTEPASPKPTDEGPRGRAAASDAPPREASVGAEDAEGAEGTADAQQSAPPTFDPTAWWNLLQSQFNQLAQFAVAHPAAAGTASGNGDNGEGDAAGSVGTAARRTATKRPSQTKSSSGAMAGRTAKKSSSNKPE